MEAGRCLTAVADAMTTTIDAMTAFIVALLALSVVMHALGEWSRRKARAEYESWRRAVAEYKAWQSAADAWRAESDARIAAAMAGQEYTSNYAGSSVERHLHREC